MVAIVPVPIVLNDYTCQIAADNYEAGLSKVVMEPTTPVEVFRGGTPGAIFPVAGTPTWKVTIDYAQDHATANSLSQYLQTNAGLIKTMIFKPKKAAVGTAPTYTIDVLIVPGPIGGDVDKIARGSVTLDGATQPVRTVA